MKKILLVFLSISLISSMMANDGSCISPTFVARSQGRDKTRQVVGLTNLTHLYNMDSWYGTFSILTGYQQSFHHSRIAHTLFGNSLVNNSAVTCDIDCNECVNSIKIQGSQLPDRNPKAWLADYFYLPPDYNGAFSVNPSIISFFLDFDFYIGLDEWLCGMYARFYAPFVHTRWNLDFCEQISTGTRGYPEGYFAPSGISNSGLLTSFGMYSNGFAPTGFGTTVVANPLRFSKIDRDKRAANGVAELRAELGWNFWQNDWYHLGINMQGAAPTGTKRHGAFLFDAVVGNGKHWELGGGVTGHYIFWSSPEENTHAGFYVDVNFTTLFNAREERTFDLIGKPNSRYMLAAKMQPNEQDLQNDVGTLASHQFANEYTPVANLTTFDIKVNVGLQTDIVAWFNYTACGWGIDIGYNFFYRSKDTFDCKKEGCNTDCTKTNICDNSQKNMWVLKGDARVYGYSTTDTTAAGTPIALSASESKASICQGTNVVAQRCVPGSTDFYNNNCAVDNHQPAFAPDAMNTPILLSLSSTSALTPIYTSIQPIFITCDDVDFARTRSLSNKLFAHASYTWERECLAPYLGIGGFIEFGNKNNCNDCNADCSTNNGCTSSVFNACDNKIINTSLSQWGIWVKGGLAFN